MNMTKTTTATKNAKKNVTKPVSGRVQLNILIAARQGEYNGVKGRATRQSLASVNLKGDLKVPAIATVNKMVEEGLLRIAGKVESGKRGKPAYIFACTDKGAKRADRAITARKAAADAHEHALAA
jgi:hypothetical protein